ncbi:MAG: ABC transporter ATP-binding protein [Angelakisella sp.]
MSYIRFENLNKSFGENQVLKNINLEVEHGQMVTLLGPSGCGKSTLLRCLAGLETVTSGKVFLEGKDITNVNPKDRDIGMVFQQYSLFPNLTVAQNVAFGLKMKKLPQEKINEKVTGMLKIVGLYEKAGQYPAQLSGGQQQRAALARAIVTQPKVLLLDEPLSAIDALLRRSLQIEIRRIQKDFCMTSIFVTHDQDEAMVMSDVIHLLYNGEVEQSANPTEMYTRPRTKFAASFIGHYNILSAKDFNEATGANLACQDVAFRPEIVEISKTPIEKENYYLFKGIITDSLSHGNILRYNVRCKNIAMDVDVLFRMSMMFTANEELYLGIKKENCLEL